MDLTAAGIPFEREYKFLSDRRFRFDFAFPAHKLAVEVDGGTWANRITRHTSGAGFRRDCEKMNLATLDGWRVLRFTADMVRDGALHVIEEALGHEKAADAVIVRIEKR